MALKKDFIHLSIAFDRCLMEVRLKLNKESPGNSVSIIIRFVKKKLYNCVTVLTKFSSLYSFPYLLLKDQKINAACKVKRSQLFQILILLVWLIYLLRKAVLYCRSSKQPLQTPIPRLCLSRFTLWYLHFGRTFCKLSILLSFYEQRWDGLLTCNLRFHLLHC